VRIYLYDISSEKTTVVSKEFKTGVKTGIYPISLSLDAGHVVWLEHNLEEKRTDIRLYDIVSNTLKSVVSTQHNDKLASFPLATFIADVDGSVLVFDQRTVSGPPYYNLYDLDEKKAIKTLQSPQGIHFHYNAIINMKESRILAYAKSESGDLLYTLDINSGDDQKLVGFYPHSFVYDDLISQEGDFANYTIQMEVSGKIADHYFGETYNIKEKTMTRYRYAYHIDETSGYFSMLKFDPQNPRNRVLLEIYEK